MKRIKYMYNVPINRGDAGNPMLEDRLYQKSLPYSTEAEEIAKAEAYNGEYTIEDDGAETTPTETEDLSALLVDHEYRLTLLELGVTE